MHPLKPISSPSTVRLTTTRPSKEVELESSAHQQGPPQLSPPHEVYSERRFLSAVGNLCDLKTDLAQTMTSRLEAMKTASQELAAEMLHKIKDAAEQAQSSRTWGMLKKIASSILAACSFIVGTSLIASGGSALIGGALIASGLISISNTLFIEYGGWDWVADYLSRDEEVKQTLSKLLPTLVGVLACGCGLAGSFQDMANTLSCLTQHSSTLIQSTLSLFGGIANAGKGFSDARLSCTQAAITALEGRQVEQAQNYRLLTDSLTAIFNGFDTSLAYARRIVNSTQFSFATQNRNF